MAIFWLAAPFAISERWWIRLGFIAIFWVLAYASVRLGIAGFQWRRKNSN
jgi:hypothetical protein